MSPNAFFCPNGQPCQILLVVAWAYNSLRLDISLVLDRQKLPRIFLGHNELPNYTYRKFSVVLHIALHCNNCPAKIILASIKFNCTLHCIQRKWRYEVKCLFLDFNADVMLCVGGGLGYIIIRRRWVIALLIYHALIDTERHLSHLLEIWGNVCNIGAVLLWKRKYLQM